MTFGESLVFLVALLSGILDSIGAAGAAAHGDNIGTSSIGISALNQLRGLVFSTIWGFLVITFLFLIFRS